eukprot:364556-Chlamydomonas_euryale.AAC.8
MDLQGTSGVPSVDLRCMGMARLTPSTSQPAKRLAKSTGALHAALHASAALTRVVPCACEGSPVEHALLVLIPLPAEHDQLLPVVARPLLEDLDQPVVDLLVLCERLLCLLARGRYRRSLDATAGWGRVRTRARCLCSARRCVNADACTTCGYHAALHGGCTSMLWRKSRRGCAHCGCCLD